MKKIFVTLSLVFLLNGCAETVALFGPASSLVGGGNAVQSSLSSAVNYGIQKKTGKSSLEHVSNFVKKNNPTQEKEKCITFLEITNTEICAAVRNNIIETKQKIVEKSKIKFLNSKQ